MPVAMTPFVRLALVALGIAGCAFPAGASPPFSIGAIYAYGDNVDVYGLQGVWVPRFENDPLQRNGFELRFASQLGRWVARNHPVEHTSLTYGNVLTELRYAPWRTASLRPFVELGFGVHLISHTQIANHNLATAFNFGSEGATGVTFGENERYEIAAFIHHASNARIKQPNQGLTYSGIRFRVALP